MRWSLQRADELLRVLELDGAEGTPVVDYSTGMRKKITLATALLHSPKLLVLDEPFEAVDPVSAATIRTILQRFVAAGGSVIFSSHVMPLVERLCDHVAVIAKGKVVASGPLDEVRGGQPLEDAFVHLVGARQAAPKGCRGSRPDPDACRDHAAGHLGQALDRRPAADLVRNAARGRPRCWPAWCTTGTREPGPMWWRPSVFGWLLGWIAGPLLTGDDAALRMDYFKLLPIPARRLAHAMLGAAFANVSLVFSLIAFAAADRARRPVGCGRPRSSGWSRRCSIWCSPWSPRRSRSRCSARRSARGAGGTSARSCSR